MRKKFCPKCGTTKGPFHRGFCTDCYLQDHPGLLEVPNLKAVQCPSCLRFFSRGEWVSGREENEAEAIKAKVRTELLSPEVSVERIRGENAYLVTVAGTLGGEKVTLEREVEVKFTKKQCDVCSRKAGDYYEAKVQLRLRDKVVDLRRLKTAFNSLRDTARSQSSVDRLASIFRHEKVKNGIDIYIGSARTAKLMVQNMQNTYDAEVKESYSLRGVDKKTGKKRYSVTYSVRV